MATPRALVASDFAVTTLMALWYSIGWRALAAPRQPHWLTVVILAITVLPVAVRRFWPRTVLALVVVGAAVAMAIGLAPHPPLAVAFGIYLIPLRLPRQEALGVLAGALLGTAAGLAAFVNIPPGSDRLGDAGVLLLVSGLLITVAWLIGYLVRQRRAHAAGLREQAERRAQEQVAQARRMVSAERLEIARELHDVVAHTMSVIAVQAGVANYVAEARPAEAARALSSIEETSRGALQEMRALLGMLRAENQPTRVEQPTPMEQRDDALDPAPGLADLDSLIERTADAQVHVRLEVHGQPTPLSAGLDLAAYRVIQEAITNVIKHAGTDSCRVRVVYQSDALTVTVTDNGGDARPGRQHAEAGHGLVGMRERVAMYGGQFRAAPLSGLGFEVTARFPLAGGAE